MKRIKGADAQHQTNYLEIKRTQHRNISLFCGLHKNIGLSEMVTHTFGKYYSIWAF